MMTISILQGLQSALRKLFFNSLSTSKSKCIGNDDGPSLKKIEAYMIQRLASDCSAQLELLL